MKLPIDLPEKPWCFTGATRAIMPGKRGATPVPIESVIRSMYRDVSEHVTDAGGILLPGPPELHLDGQWVVMRWPAFSLSTIGDAMLVAMSNRH